MPTTLDTTPVLVEPAELTLTMEPQKIESPIKRDEMMLMEAGAKMLRDRASIVAIITDEDSARASDLLSEIKITLTRADDLRTKLKAPSLQVGREIDREFKRVTTLLEEAKDLIEKRVVFYVRAKQEAERKEQERLKREEEERALQMAVKLSAAGRTQMAEAILTVASETIESPAIKPVAAVGEHSRTTIAEHWTYRVVDFSAVPDEFKMENAVRIRQVIRSGVRTIPGLDIYDEGSVRTVR